MNFRRSIGTLTLFSFQEHKADGKNIHK